MTKTRCRILISLVSVAVFAVSPLRADAIADIVTNHIEAIGGKERIKELAAIRATGRVKSGRDEVRFTLTAARPDKVRLETEKGNRTLVQGTDGKDVPWEFDTGTWPPVYHPMAAASARTFASDSEFDDPLVTGASRGFTFEYGGEVDVGEGRKLLRVLVTKKLVEPFSVLVDPKTYYIVKRVEFRTSAGGRKLQVWTHYDDFRAVDGVVLPHKIAVSIDGRLMQQMQITRIEANPKLEAQTFSRPKSTVPAAQKS
jgi:hypothetical protein